MAHLPISLVFYRLNLKGWFLELLVIPVGIEYPYKGVLFHIVEYYLSIKRNETLIHDAMWMSLENILHQRSQTLKGPYCMILFIQNIQGRQIY